MHVATATTGPTTTAAVLQMIVYRSMLSRTELSGEEEGEKPEEALLKSSKQKKIGVMGGLVCRAAALDIWYFSLLPSYENEESATSLAWLRHAVRVNQTGMELQPMQPVPLFQFG